MDMNIELAVICINTCEDLIALPLQTGRLLFGGGKVLEWFRYAGCSSPTMKRPTIQDIASHAKVSKSAASYALNGLPGVSEPTRLKVLAIAADLGWQPSSAARALSSSRTHVVGFVIAREARVMAHEPYFMALLGGIEAELSRHHIGLLLQVVGNDGQEEEQTYRRWWQQRQIDGVLFNDLRQEDTRMGLMKELGIPSVVVGHPPRQRPDNMSAILVDNEGAMLNVAAQLVALGHHHLAHVSGDPRFLHIQARSTALQQYAEHHGLTLETHHSDLTGEQGAKATQSLLALDKPPTAIIYDNDLMAIAGLSVAQRLGRRIPEELAIVAWDDSALCRVTHPALAAVHQDIIRCGEIAAKELIALIDGQPGRECFFQTPELVIRQTLVADSVSSDY